MCRGSALFVALFVASCVETVPLGNECADQRERCIDEPDAGAPTEPIATRPPRTMDAGAGARVPAPPAIVDAGAPPPPVEPPRPPLFPELDNTSFDLRGEPGPLTSPEDDRTMPWVACRIGWTAVDSAFVQGAVDEQMVAVRPTEGGSFMEYVRSAADQPSERAPLSQRLDVPLEPRRRYALRMDLQSSADVNVSLEIWAGGRGSCAPTTLLASTGRIAWGGWQSVCVTFEAPASSSPVSELMLIPNDSLVPNSGTRVFLDNVRADPSCR